MIRTPALETVCLELFRHPPNWKGIIERFRLHPAFLKHQRLTLGQYAGLFSEIHMDLCLEEIAAQNPELHIQLRPRKRRFESTKYTFEYTMAGRLVARRKGRTKNFEYDKVIKVDGVPVVLEMKLRGWTPRGKAHTIRSHKNRRYEYTVYSGPGIEYSLDMSHLNRRLKPLRGHFNSDVGFVMVIGADMYDIYSDERVRSSIVQEFKQRNGIVVPLYTTREAFKEEVGDYVAQERLLVGGE